NIQKRKVNSIFHSEYLYLQMMKHQLNSYPINFKVFYELRRRYQLMYNTSVMNTDYLILMSTAYGKQLDSDSLNVLWNTVKSAGIEVPKELYQSLIQAYSNLNDINGLSSVLYSSKVDQLEDDKIKYAKLLFPIPSNDPVVYESLMNFYLKMDQIDVVLHLFRDFTLKCNMPNKLDRNLMKIYLIVVKAIFSDLPAKLAHQVFRSIKKRTLPESRDLVYQYFIQFFSESEDVHMAEKILMEAIDKNVAVDCSAIIPLVSAYLEKEDMKNALKVLEIWMKANFRQNEYKPTTFEFLYKLYLKNLFFTAESDYQKREHILNCFKKFNRSISTINTGNELLLKEYCNAGNIVMAVKLLQTLQNDPRSYLPIRNPVSNLNAPLLSSVILEAYYTTINFFCQRKLHLSALKLIQQLYLLGNQEEHRNSFSFKKKLQLHPKVFLALFSLLEKMNDVEYCLKLIISMLNVNLIPDLESFEHIFRLYLMQYPVENFKNFKKNSKDLHYSDKIYLKEVLNLIEFENGRFKKFKELLKFRVFNSILSFYLKKIKNLKKLNLNYSTDLKYLEIVFFEMNTENVIVEKHLMKILKKEFKTDLKYNRHVYYYKFTGSHSIFSDGNFVPYQEFIYPD
ncbi:hypothetical protein HK099_000403, partial [Clydaea vesicula]